MKVKDLKALLATYNQDADVRVIAHCREYDFSLAIGGSEGVTKGTTTASAGYTGWMSTTRRSPAMDERSEEQRQWEPLGYATTPCFGGHVAIFTAGATDGRVPEGMPCSCGAFVAHWSTDPETGEERLYWNRA